MTALLAMSCASVATREESSVGSIVERRTGVVLPESEKVVSGEEYRAGPAAREILTHPLTPDDAVRIALLHSPRVRASLAEIGVAQADLAQGRLPRNPVAEAEIRFPGRPFEIALMQELLDLVRLRPRRRLAEAAFQEATSRVANEVLARAADVRAAFLDLQAAQEVVKMRGTIVEARRLSAELALRTHEAGNITDLDLELEQALHEQAKLELSRSELSALEKRERINALLGLWGPDTAWQADAGLPELPSEDIDVAGLESQAVEQRLDLLAARQQVEVAHQTAGLARGQFWEGLAVGVHVEREPGGPRTRGPAVELPIPIFDRGRPRRRRAAAIVARAEAEYAALAIEARAQARIAGQRLVAARDRVAYYRDVVLPRRARIVEQTRLEFNAMLIGAFQLIEATQGESEARQEYIEAQRDYWLARAGVTQVTTGGVRFGDETALRESEGGSAIGGSRDRQGHRSAP